MILRKDLQKLDPNYALMLGTNPETHLKAYKIIKYQPNKGIIFTLTRPADSIRQILGKDVFSKNKISIVDSISKRIGIHTTNKNDIYLESSMNLTKISLSLQKLLKNTEDKPSFLILDSLSKLTFYHNPNTLFQFMNLLINRCKTTNTNLIVLGIEKDIPKNLRDNIEEMCDKTIRLK